MFRWRHRSTWPLCCKWRTILMYSKFLRSLPSTSTCFSACAPPPPPSSLSHSLPVLSSSTTSLLLIPFCSFILFLLCSSTTSTSTLSFSFISFYCSGRSIGVCQSLRVLRVSIGAKSSNTLRMTWKVLLSFFSSSSSFFSFF